MTFWTYLLRCNDDSFYCGHTDNLEARIAQHHTGTITGYTKHRRPVSLAWSQEFPSRLEALEAERRIKGWTQAKKEALIRGDWDGLFLLARNWQRSGRPSASSGRTDPEVSRRSSPLRTEPVKGRPETSSEQRA